LARQAQKQQQIDRWIPSPSFFLIMA
jgi:hypothetical protein